MMPKSQQQSTSEQLGQDASEETASSDSDEPPPAVRKIGTTEVETKTKAPIDMLSSIHDSYSQTRLESRGLESHTKSSIVEEERDSLRQQNSNLKVAFKEMSEQLLVYKNRCAGVDTISLMLKESKLDVIRLSKRNRMLETVVGNLQNRLSTHGLSSSVNIEETELFVPGPSKQTLDNLARENARLRSQLKNSENQAGKKPSEDLQTLKSSIETLEGENNQLKAQVLEMEGLKLRIIQQYEMELKAHTGKAPLGVTSNIKTGNSTTQTDDVGPSDVDALRNLLSKVSERCQVLDRRLENTQKEVDEGRTVDNTQQFQQAHGVDQGKYDELREEYEKVVLMNQTWSSHCNVKDQEIDTLRACVKELQNPERINQIVSRATENLQEELGHVRASFEEKQRESLVLKQDNDRLRQELARRSSQPQFDMSIVEILKQQIQVCTEDFNTERRDREQAVHKNKQLQEELNRLSKENSSLKIEQDAINNRLLMQTYSPVSQGGALPYSSYRPDYNRLSQPNSFQSHGPQQPNSNIRPYIPRGSVSSGTSSISPASSISSPSSNVMQRPLSEGSSGIYSELSDNLASETHARGPEADFRSLPKAAAGNMWDRLPSMSQLEARHNPTSMPPPRWRQQPPLDQANGEYMACPKCSREFSESENQELLKHMEMCKE